MIVVCRILFLCIVFTRPTRVLLRDLVLYGVAWCCVICCAVVLCYARLSEEQVRELLEDLSVPADDLATAAAMGSNNVTPSPPAAACIHGD